MFRLIIIIFILVSASHGLENPTVGAIRWDAWTGGHVTKQVERSLGPQKYHHRLPWFAKVIKENNVKIDGSLQSVMDKEINFASDAGLDYWAFLTYPESSPMSLALTKYLKSSQRTKINFSLILHNVLDVNNNEWKNENSRIVKLLLHPEYQTVLNKRPLVYIFKKNFDFKRISQFRKLAKKFGINPYIVYMGWNPASNFKRLSHKGIDAVSSYAKSSKRKKFSSLVKEIKKDWHNAARASVPYIPLVTTGWDKGPRKDNPVSWEHNAKYHHQKVFPATALPNEIANHLYDAITFIKNNSKVCLANTAIIYAWNEHDEGAWLSPTWQTGGHINTERLDAIRKILRHDTRRKDTKILD